MRGCHVAARAGLLIAIGLLTACAAQEARLGYVHGRAEYHAFRQQRDGLLEPNYLPFMAERLVIESRAGRFSRRLRAGLGLDVAPAEEWLVFCHWPADRFPLAVFIEAPAISEDLLLSQAPGATRDAAGYVKGVERALRLWEQALEGLVTFERVSRRSAADVVVRLRAGEPPGDDAFIQVLGTAPLGGACRYRGGDPRSGQAIADQLRRAPGRPGAAGGELPWPDPCLASVLELLRSSVRRGVARRSRNSASHRGGRLVSGGS